MAIKDLYPSIHPTLDLNFAGTRTVDPRITFSRASTATYFDEFGVMRTVPANSPRIDFDPVTGECKGLLIEEQRTNLLLNSATLATQNVTVAAVAHTLTFYGTGTVTLSGAATGVLVGTGAANRVELTFTPTAGTLTLTVTGSCTQGQLEVGAFPTSYIPTTSAQATRAADSATMTGSNFSSWYRHDEGTFLAAYSRNSDKANGSQIPCIVSDGTGNNVIAITDNVNGTGDRALIITNGVSQVNMGSINYTADQLIVRSVGYKLNDVATSANGAAVWTDDSALIPAVNQLSIGFAPYFSSSRLNGHIRRFAYYANRLSNTNLRALTT